MNQESQNPADKIIMLAGQEGFESPHTNLRVVFDVEGKIARFEVKGAGDSRRCVVITETPSC